MNTTKPPATTAPQPSPTAEELAQWVELQEELPYGKQKGWLKIAAAELRRLAADVAAYKNGQAGTTSTSNIAADVTPESFKRGLADIEAGRTMPLDEAMKSAPAADATADSVWCAEAPTISGYYAAKEPQRRGKLGEQEELGTHDFKAARHFATKAECEQWIAANPYPAWKPTEHGIMDATAGGDYSLRRLDETIRALAVAAMDRDQDRYTESSTRIHSIIAEHTAHAVEAATKELKDEHEKFVRERNQKTDAAMLELMNVAQVKSARAEKAEADLAAMTGSLAAEKHHCGVVEHKLATQAAEIARLTARVKELEAHCRTCDTANGWADKCARLTAENAEMQEDKARLDWLALRPDYEGGNCDREERRFYVFRVPTGWDYYKGGENLPLRSAIDAARREGGNEK